MSTTLCVRKAIVFLKKDRVPSVTPTFKTTGLFFTLGFPCAVLLTGHTQFPRSQRGSAYAAKMFSSKGNVSVHILMCIMVCTLDYILERGVCELNVFVLNRLLFFQWKSLESPAGMVSQNLRVSGETVVLDNHTTITCLVCPLKAICNPSISTVCAVTGQR